MQPIDELLLSVSPMVSCCPQDHTWYFIDPDTYRTVNSFDGLLPLDARIVVTPETVEVRHITESGEEIVITYDVVDVEIDDPQDIPPRPRQ